MEGECVVVRRRMLVVVARHSLDDQGDKSSEQSGGDNSTDGPDEDLAADDYTAEIDILFLLLLGRTKKPALLRLVEGT